MQLFVISRITAMTVATGLTVLLILEIYKLPLCCCYIANFMSIFSEVAYSAVCVVYIYNDKKHQMMDW